jgi:hypothetical protein
MTLAEFSIALTFVSLLDTALAAGYTVKRIGYTGLPLEVVLRGGNGKKVPAILRPIQVIDAFLIKIRPQLFAYQMLYELRP